MNIDVKYVLTEPDLAAAIARNMRRGRPRGVVAAVSWLVPGAVFVALGDTCWGVGMLTIGSAYVLLLLQSAGFVARRWAKRMGGEVQLSLYDEWFSYTVGGTTAAKRWDKVRVVVGPEYLTLGEVRKPPALVVPKRVFTEEQQAELTEFLEGRPKRQLLHV